MAVNRGPGFTVEWKIEVGMLRSYPYTAYSYDFFLQDLQNTAWRLYISLFESKPLCVSIYRHEDDEAGPNEVEIEYEVDLFLAQQKPYSYRSLRGNFLTTVTKKFKQGEWSEDLKFKFQGVIDALEDDDVLLLRCCIWSGESSFSHPVMHFVRSYGGYTECFQWKVNDFSLLRKGDIISYKLKKTHKNAKILTFDFFLDDDNDTICIQETSGDLIYINSVFALDARGGELLCLENCCPYDDNDEPITVPLLVCKSQFMAIKEKYLSNDQLTLYFNLRRTVTEAVLEKIVVGDSNIDDGFPLLRKHNVVKKNCRDAVTPTSPASSTNPSCSINSDLISHSSNAGNNLNCTLSYTGSYMYHLFKAEQLTDFELKIGSETLRVHKSILAARSPVFLAMLTNEMRESSQQSVDIVDLEIDTVKYLLQFMYLDYVPDLNWDSVLMLYSAADKYDVFDLRKKCSEILKSKLCVKTVCSVLQLAEKHVDDDLQDFVKEFIFKNEACVIKSKEWENFVKDDATLAANVMFYLCKKRVETTD